MSWRKSRLAWGSLAWGCKAALCYVARACLTAAATRCCPQGFRLDASAKVTLVKQVEYNGQNIEAAWPLGAAINDLSA